jgi:NADH-quinone oxidoreductase subunit N
MIAMPGLNLLATVPEIAVLVTALLVMGVDLFLRSEQRSLLAWLALAGVLVAGGLCYIIWDTASPAQGMLAADGYALFLSLAILAAAALAILFSVEYAERIGLAQGEYYTLLLLATAGMMFLAAAINLVTIFLALEMLSIALYVLVGLNRAEPRSAEAALKYFVLGAFASGFLLYGMALVYGQAGTASLDGIREYVGSLGGHPPALLLAGLGLMLVGFGFKVALVPFQMWTPDVYHGAPTSVTAFMSAAAKIAGFAAMGRVVMYAGGELGGIWQPLLAILAALTMTVGNLAALRQQNLKRMLAYSSIAQAGYVLAGLAAGTEAGTASALFYLLTYALTSVAAFAVVIAVGRLAGGRDGDESLGDFSGLAARKPGLAAAMAVCMLSLAGLPPLAGFVGKVYVFGAAVQGGLLWLAVVGVINSVVSAYYYLRVVAAMYLRAPDRAGRAEVPVCPALAVGVVLACAAVVLLGLWPGPVLDLARTAVAALLGG